MRMMREHPHLRRHPHRHELLLQVLAAARRKREHHDRFWAHTLLEEGLYTEGEGGRLARPGAGAYDQGAVARETDHSALEGVQAQRLAKRRLRHQIECRRHT